MKRFVSIVMAAIVALGLSGMALDAHALPTTTVAGDTGSPSENGTGSGGSSGGDGGDNGGNGGKGSTPGEPGPVGGSGDPSPPPAGVSVPRVMLAGFTSTPTEVVAGQDFTVSFTLRNTSTRTRVQNIKVSLSSGEGAAFLPSDGSSSIYIPNIYAGEDSIQTMSFHSLPSLEERPYQLQLTVEYEDAVPNAYQSQEMVSVSVKQPVRADTSVPEIMPDMLMVGQDASVTFSIHNQGKTKLYNAKATVKDGQAVSGSEIFIGTIEPGTSGAVDMMLHADEESENPAVIEVTYESVDGKVTALTKEVPMMVMPFDMGEEFPGEEMPVEEPGMGILPLILGGLALLLLILLVVMLVRRSRRRSRDREDADSLSMMDEDPLISADNLQG